MAERPILFTGPMVRAILDGSKDQTRRVVKPQPPEADQVFCWSAPGESGKKAAEGLYFRDPAGLHFHARCPYGVPGDLLYVRENARLEFELDRYFVRFQADQHRGSWIDDPCDATMAWIEKARWRAPYGPDVGHSPWRPGMLVPKSLSRIWLRVTDVRVERVQEISEEDALAEGISQIAFVPDDGYPVCDGYMVGPDDGSTLLNPDPRDAFRRLWDSINAARGFGWDLNPWVWVVSFERATEEEESR